MKIADYGKAITSYIESPTKDQKDKLKLQAGLLEEYLGDDLEYQRAVDDGFQGTKEDYYRYKSTSEEDRTFLAEGTPFDFSGLSVPQLKLLYKRYTGTDGPSDPKQLISELKRLIKGLDEDGIPFAKGGRVHLAEGTPPPKKPRQLKDLYERINRAVLAVSSRTVPPELIVPQLETLTQKYIKDGLISGEDARKFAIDRKDYWDKWISENPGGTTPTFDFDNEGTATEVSQEEIIKRINEADGGRVKFGDGTITPVLNLGKNIKKDPNLIKLFNDGDLYHLRLGKDKIVHYGTKKQLETIFKNRTTAGGNVRADLELKKYKKNFLPRNKFLKFLQDKGIQATTINPKVFAQRYGLKFEPNPYFKTDVIVDVSKLKNQDFVDGIIKRQVASGFGTEEQKLQFRKFDDDSVMRRYFNKLRKNMQKKFSVRKIEELLAANKASGLNLSHMDDLYSQYVTTRNLGYVPKDFNTQDLDKFDKKFREIYKKRNNLFKNKSTGWEEKVVKLNKDGITLAKASDGFKQFIVKKPDGKTRVVGVDLTKTIDPEDILKGKRIKDLSDEDIDLLIENKNKIIKGTNQATWKKLLKSFGKKLPLAGAILGINEVANAVEMGVTNPVDLFAAYQISADAALEGKKYREDPEFRKKSRAETFSIPLDEGTFEAIDEQTSTFGKYNDQIKNIKLP